MYFWRFNHFINKNKVIQGAGKSEKPNEVRQTATEFLNCTRDDIFALGCSESNNLLIRSFANNGNHIITTVIEQYEDFCTMLVPKHCKTRPILGKIMDA